MNDRLVADKTLTPATETPPNVTVVPLMKPVPVNVTSVPPARGPLLGLTCVTDGPGKQVEPYVPSVHRQIRLPTRSMHWPV